MITDHATTRKPPMAAHSSISRPEDREQPGQSPEKSIEAADMTKQLLPSQASASASAQEQKLRLITRIKAARSYLKDQSYPNTRILHSHKDSSFEKICSIFDHVFFLAESSSSTLVSINLFDELALFCKQNHYQLRQYTGSKRQKLLHLIERANSVFQHTFEILKQDINSSSCEEACKKISDIKRQNFFCVVHDFTNLELWPELDRNMLFKTAKAGMEYCQLSDSYYTPGKFSGPPQDHISIFQMDMAGMVFSDKSRRSHDLPEDVHSQVMGMLESWTLTASSHWQFCCANRLFHAIDKVLMLSEEYQRAERLLTDSQKVELCFAMSSICCQEAGQFPSIDRQLLIRQRLSQQEREQRVQYEKNASRYKSKMGAMERYIHKARDTGMTTEQEINFHIKYGLAKELQEKKGEAQEHFVIATKAGSDLSRHRQLMSRLNIRFSHFPINPEGAVTDWKARKLSETRYRHDEDLYLPFPEKLTTMLDVDVYIKVLLHGIYSGSLSQDNIDSYISIIAKADPETGQYLEAVTPLLQGNPLESAVRLEPLSIRPREKYLLAHILKENDPSDDGQKKALKLFTELFDRQYHHAGLAAARLVLSLHSDIEAARTFLRKAKMYFIQHNIFDRADECRDLLNECSPEEPPADYKVTKTVTEPGSHKKKRRTKHPQGGRHISGTEQAAGTLIQSDVTASGTNSHEREISFPSPQGDGKDISMVKKPARFEDSVSVSGAAGSLEEPAPQESAISIHKYPLTPNLLRDINQLIKGCEFEKAEEMLRITSRSEGDKRLTAQFFQMNAWMLRQRWFHNEYGSHGESEKSHCRRQLAILNEAKQQSLRGIKTMGLNMALVERTPDVAVSGCQLDFREKRTVASLFAELGHVYRRLGGICFDSGLFGKGSEMSRIADSLNPERLERGITGAPLSASAVGTISDRQAQIIRRGMKD